MSTGIYLDNNATTPVDERVIEAVAGALRDCFGNPSSPHGFGEDAARAVEAARISVGRLIGARSPAEIVFTSGGTESINTAFHLALSQRKAGVLLTATTEHAAVLRPGERWAENGFELELVPVNGAGRIDTEGLRRRIQELGSRCAFVSLQWANNETGVLVSEDELASVARACRLVDAPFHVDAVQVPGKRPVDVAALDVDLLSISAHKFHGPKGIGALYVRSGLEAGPHPSLISGGPQERERRGGTHNVPGIVGMGSAAELAREHARDEEACEGIRALRDELEQGLTGALPGTRVNGAGEPRLDNTTSIAFAGIDGEMLVMALAAEGLAVATGAACSSESRAPSHVLLAMGLGEKEAAGTIRFSLSRMTTREEIEGALELVRRTVPELRALEAV